MTDDLARRWPGQRIRCGTCGEPIADDQRCFIRGRWPASTREVVEGTNKQHYCTRCGLPAAEGVS